MTTAPSVTSEGQEVISLLPVAAHMKLLIDAPEGKAIRLRSKSTDTSALYSFLAHHEFLQAAFLWLVARVVKESLAAMPEDVSGVSVGR